MGIGRAIISRCFEDARARGATRMECYSTLAAEAFYRSQGFATVRPIDPVAFGPPLPSLLMERML
jgi:GNAT superfamily N-acetyltransferase